METHGEHVRTARRQLWLEESYLTSGDPDPPRPPGGPSPGPWPGRSAPVPHLPAHSGIHGAPIGWHVGSSGGPEPPARSAAAPLDDGPRTAVTVLAPAGTSVAAARSWVRQHLQELAADPTLVEDAAALLDELVANAVRHTGSTRIAVRLRLHEGVLEVSVHDEASAVRPRLCHPPADQSCGRGLLIVDALAQAWGTRTGPTGKWVWFQLSALPRP
jgi:anti-sigma regulatory factor (Ser/Thr protein kinase)